MEMVWIPIIDSSSHSHISKRPGISQKWARNSVVECSLCNCITAKSPAFDPPPVQFIFFFYFLFLAVLRTNIPYYDMINQLPLCNVMQRHTRQPAPFVVEMSPFGKRWSKWITTFGRFFLAVRGASPWFGPWEKVTARQKGRSSFLIWWISFLPRSIVQSTGYFFVNGLDQLDQ